MLIYLNRKIIDVEDIKFERKMENKKNIIIIIIDAFRTKNISLFGYEKITDKNLKKIAKSSIVLNDFFSSSNATAPSLTTLFTGKYPNNHGIIHQFPYTTQEEINKLNKVNFWLPSFLRDKGYETIAIDWIGLWFKDGFNYYEEKEKKQSKLKKFLKIPIVKKFLLGLPNWAYKYGKKIVKTRASEEFTPAKDTMNLGISKIQETTFSNKPFFLFMHFWDTHFPFPTTKFRGSGKNDINEVVKKIDSNQREYFKKRITDINLYSIKDMIDKYDVSIKMVDKQIGELYKFLKKNNLWDDTILIILGDHGTSLTDHENYFSSSGLFDETIHVPFIIHLPGFEGKKIDGLVQNVDILPTILDYFDWSVNEEFDGKSFLNLIKGQQIRDKVFFFDGLAPDIKGVRTKNRKLIIARENSCNLCKSQHHKGIEEYDLIKDPNELTNIFNVSSELMKFLENEEDKSFDNMEGIKTYVRSESIFTEEKDL